MLACCTHKSILGTKALIKPPPLHNIPLLVNPHLQMHM